jgi:xylulokinase
MYLLGFDVGSSSVKASVLDASSGASVASAFSPKTEMKIDAPQPGWAEQDPGLWWEHLKLALSEVLTSAPVRSEDIGSIGISYQMHGLLLVDRDKNVLRPAIIWCDSRAVEVGERAFQEIGPERCLERLLNSPGNFTASKLGWVKENEPETYDRVHKLMLPGDYIAMRLTGEINTTVPGLSEGIFWDFASHEVAGFLLEHYGIDRTFIPEVVPTFSIHGELSGDAASELGLKVGTKVAYRAGDQPNNAFSLSAVDPGQVAATAGTSGVVYGVSDVVKADAQSRVNTFAHVNHERARARLGVLLCINGTGALNAWLRENIGGSDLDYESMNRLAGEVPIGSDGLAVLPFGNGAERVLGNRDIGCRVHGLDFQRHSRAHLLRAAQEGIVFALAYGMACMNELGIELSVIKAGQTNMFQSPVFRDTFAGVTGATIELYETDGAEGAARAAGVGAGYYKSFEDAFVGLKRLAVVEPEDTRTAAYADAYRHWLDALESVLR